MIFVGDIAHPFDSSPNWTEMSPPWNRQPTVSNLEGPLSVDATEIAHRKLFNHPSIVPALETLGVQVALLANNHVLDLPERLGPTLATLDEIGIDAIGAGASKTEASRAATITENGAPSRILNFGWRPIGCQSAGMHSPGVNPLAPDHVLSSIAREKVSHPDSSIVVAMHWNYEMELYPQPAHRELAFACIEAGADLIVGHHPHRVGGFEYYRGRLIAYSLGNFWLPHGIFFDGTLRFDDDANLELALEWHNGEPARAHWFHYHPESHRLEMLQSEAVEDSAELQQRTPYAGMSHSEYKKWFPAHRVKRKLLPVYRNFGSTLMNSAKDLYVESRHRALISLERSGLRSRLERRRP